MTTDESCERRAASQRRSLRVALACVLLLGAAPANAASWIDWFATPDQQGRWHFEHGDYKQAAAHFQDPAWKGLSFYRAGDYSNALVEFSRLDTAEGAFLQGNAQARLGHFEAAIKSYDNALKARPQFPEAEANRKLVVSLIPKQDDEPPPEAPDLDPDDIKFDDKGKKGQKKQMNAAQLRKLTTDQWMKNLQVSPSEFLKQKFHIEAEEKQP